MTQLFRSERAKPNRLPDQGGDACVPRHSEAPREEGKCPAPDHNLALLEMVGAAHSLNPALAASQPRTGDASAAIQRP
jgi:hypothetical protein